MRSWIIGLRGAAVVTGCSSSSIGLQHGAPGLHQVAELPPLAVTITEHRLHTVGCACGASTRASLPAGVTCSAFGPRLQAAVATLTTRQRLSRRQTAETVQELFGCPISVGAVDRIISRVADRLAAPYNELRAQLAVGAGRVRRRDQLGVGGQTCLGLGRLHPNARRDPDRPKPWPDCCETAAWRHPDRDRGDGPLQRLQPPPGRATAGVLGTPRQRLRSIERTAVAGRPEAGTPSSRRSPRWCSPRTRNIATTETPAGSSTRWSRYKHGYGSCSSPSAEADARKPPGSPPIRNKLLSRTHQHANLEPLTNRLKGSQVRNKLLSRTHHHGRVGTI